jgi:hypothetical protein
MHPLVSVVNRKRLFPLQLAEASTTAKLRLAPFTSGIESKSFAQMHTEVCTHAKSEADHRITMVNWDVGMKKQQHDPVELRSTDSRGRLSPHTCTNHSLTYLGGLPWLSAW